MVDKNVPVFVDNDGTKVQVAWATPADGGVRRINFLEEYNNTSFSGDDLKFGDEEPFVPVLDPDETQAEPRTFEESNEPFVDLEGDVLTPDEIQDIEEASEIEVSSEPAVEFTEPQYPTEEVQPEAFEHDGLSDAVEVAPEAPAEVHEESVSQFEPLIEDETPVSEFEPTVEPETPVSEAEVALPSEPVEVAPDAAQAAQPVDNAPEPDVEEDTLPADGEGEVIVDPEQGDGIETGEEYSDPEIEEAVLEDEPTPAQLDTEDEASIEDADVVESSEGTDQA